MAQLTITGSRPGLRKISMTRAIQNRAGLGLAAAKRVTDDVLDGGTVTVALTDIASARTLAHELEALGATCHVESGVDAG